MVGSAAVGSAIGVVSIELESAKLLAVGITDVVIVTTGAQYWARAIVLVADTLRGPEFMGHNVPQLSEAHTVWLVVDA